MCSQVVSAATKWKLQTNFSTPTIWERLLLKWPVYNWSSSRHNIHHCFHSALFHLLCVVTLFALSFAKTMQQEARMCKRPLWLHHLSHPHTSTHAIANPPVFISSLVPYAFTFASFSASLNTLYIVTLSSSSYSSSTPSISRLACVET